MDLQMPVKVMDIGHCDDQQPTRVIQRLQSNGVVEEDWSIVEWNHLLVAVKVPEMAGLPRGNHTVLWAPDQDHFVEFQDPIPEGR